MNNPWIDVGLFAVRTLGVGLLIYAMSRYLPRRSGGGLAAYDFVFFWMMGGLAVAPLYDIKIRFVDTVAAVVTIFLCHYVISGLALANPRWAALLSGAPIQVVEQGSIRKDGMERALLPLEILMSELRHAGAGKVSEVETAVLETTGHVSIVKKDGHLPVTAGDVGKEGPDHPLPLVLVVDGKVQKHNLTKLGVEEIWLREKLQMARAPGPESLYAAIWEGAEPIYWASKAVVT